MTEEEKETIKELKSLLYTGNLTQYGKRKLIETYENLIQKQQAELKKKDKKIDLMAEELEYYINCSDNLEQTTKEEIKQYFEKQVEKE